MVKIKGNETLYLFVAFIVSAAIIFLAASITYHVIHEDDEKDQWDVFVDKANAYTDHVLANGEYHKDGSWDYINWSEQSCSTNIVTVSTVYKFSPSMYYDSYPGDPTRIYINETLTYGHLFADEDCLRIEWHSSGSYGMIYLKDRSQDDVTIIEDHVVRIQYIPYSSITTMTVFEVIE